MLLLLLACKLANNINVDGMGRLEYFNLVIVAATFRSATVSAALCSTTAAAALRPATIAATLL